MLDLLVFRQKLKAFYGRYDMYITPLIKFGMVLAALLLVNKNIGYLKVLQNPLIPVVLALISGVLPYGGICWIISGFVLAHISSVSMEMAIITALFLLITALLYYGFQPGDSYLLYLTPIMFCLRIPYVVPILVGLGGRLVSVIPVECGVILYYILVYVRQNAGPLTDDASVDITQKYAQMINGILSNKTLILLLIAFAITVIVVYLIRNLSMDYSWVIAVIAGIVALLVSVFIGDFMFGISVDIVHLLAGVLASAAIAAVYNFFVFNVDYTRTEYTQFEDDDYYYYVKAVPKITVSEPDVKVQRINSRKSGGRRVRPEKPVQNLPKQEG